jgi:hypothetical protein
MDQIKFTLTGIAPLIMNSDRMANPLDADGKYLKSLTAKRKKTDADHLEIFKANWMGCIYYDDELGPYVPGEAVQACLVEGGKESKLGSTLKKGAIVLEEKCPVKYRGPKDKEDLFEHGAFTDIRNVVVNRARTPRCRPIFPEWEINCTVAYNERVLNAEAVIHSMEDAGEMRGLLDYRPRYGRFAVSLG